MTVMIAGALLVLFTRIAAPAALEHETRAKLHAHLVAHPGSSRRDLCHALGIHPMTLVHHLQVLASLGVVVARREGREVLYHVAHAPPDVPATLRAQPRRLIARLLAQRPLTQRQIAEATGFSQRLVAYHLARMEAIVEATPGRPHRYALRGPLGEAAAAAAGEGSPAAPEPAPPAPLRA
ncbi:MAG TPA: winged helix-turn-helix transcriptional regulator [Candidatus Thermoplasmatota archaeon]|nr:winged helix-turn-helix transcriptional regulator [Candidatus Thermoplasmatota archaeon]